MSAVAAAPPATKPWRFDGVVRLTRIGTTYIIFTVVVGFAALNTGNNALYIGLTFMLGCLLLSGIASKGGLKHLELSLSDLDQAWAGRAADARLRIRNDSRIWNVRDVVVAAADLAQPLLIPILERQKQMVLVAPFVFSRRGLVQVKTLDLYTRYPFGFFLKKRRLRINSEVVVYPRLLGDPDDHDAFQPSTGEETPVNRAGHGSEIHGFRDYAAGDSMRQVYWKKTASMGRLVVKQTDADATRIVHVVVDPYRPARVSEETFESMISEAATYIHHALAREMEVVLSLPRLTVRSRDLQGPQSMFRALALLDATHEAVHQTMERNAVLFSVRGRT
jgi:uncharacterized protein (DUF58 family)